MEKISYLVDKKENSALTIIGNYWKGAKDSGVILLHMMPSMKESWDDFAGKLNKKGHHVLAIDLRGHGESTKYTVSDNIVELNYKRFSDKDHQASIADVLGAQEYLESVGVSPKHTAVGGASIGANLALQFLATISETKAAFLLSPGLDYRGIKVDPFMRALSPDQRLYLVAAENDEYSAETVRALQNIRSAETFVKMYEQGGHGTRLFDAHPELMEDIVAWLEQESA